MFLFNKNNALPRSRQSSIDSSNVADASIPDVWPSQSSDSSSYVDLPSPDYREKPHNKRTSILNLRSRSNTGTSSTPSVISSIVRPDSSRPSSQDLRSMASGYADSFDVAGPKRSLFSRGRRLKRDSSPFGFGYNLSEIGEGDSKKRTSVMRKMRGKRSVYGADAYDLRPHISSPFDFKHLTHTHRNQFMGLDRTSQNELVAEFWAVRASQVPRQELHGIKADDLRFQNFSSETLNEVTCAPRSTSTLDAASPPISRQQSYETSSTSSPAPDSPTASRVLKHSRSVESFSQPVVKARTHRYTQSANARSALARIEDMPDNTTATRRVPLAERRGINRNSGVWDIVAPQLPTIAGFMPSVLEDDDWIAQAVTTPDDTAMPALSPPFSPGLEGVPEEPERFFNPRPAPRPPTRTSTMESFTFAQPQRSPTMIRRDGRASPSSSPKSPMQQSPRSRPMSQLSDTLGSPTPPIFARRNLRMSVSRRQSNCWRTLETSWEDDIDYCYDHAAEADCDFEWDRKFNEGNREENKLPSAAAPFCPQTTGKECEDDPTLRTRFFPGVFRPSLLVPSAASVPELDHRSALSASTNESGVLTPSDLLPPAPVHEVSVPDMGTHPFTESEGFSLTPSLLVPADFKYQSMREEMYDELLADYEGSGRHYPLLEPAQSVAGSSRSSGTRLSKRSSYDSSSMSGANSISSPARRSASSSGSLPELVHSRRARKTFDMMVDQLSAQVASFAHIGDDDAEDQDDDDTTPPGRAPVTERTFFASEDEDNVEQQPRPKVERTITEPVSAVDPAFFRSSVYHERASSEGAAKLLGSPIPLQPPPKSRLRAVSQSNTQPRKPAALSLFPTPPRTPQLRN